MSNQENKKRDEKKDVLILEIIYLWEKRLPLTVNKIKNELLLTSYKMAKKDKQIEEKIEENMFYLDLLDELDESALIWLHECLMLMSNIKETNKKNNNLQKEVDNLEGLKKKYTTGFQSIIVRDIIDHKKRLLLIQPNNEEIMNMIKEKTKPK